MMLNKDSWSYKPNGTFPLASNSKAIKEASSFASDSTMPLTVGMKSNSRHSINSEFCGHDTILDKANIVDNNSYSYRIGDVNHTGHDLDFFGNTESKDSSDLLYYGWPEIENFDDVDRMFRTCDSTFDLGFYKEDELGWLSSADDLGGSGDVLKSDVKIPCPEPSDLENISDDCDFSNGYFSNNSAMISAPIRCRDRSWISEKSDSCRSIVIGPDIDDRKDGVIPQEQGLGFSGNIQPRISTNSHFRTGSAPVAHDHKKQIKQQRQSEEKSKEHCLGNGSFDQINDLPNEVMKFHSGFTSHQAFGSVHMQQQHHALAPDSYRYLPNSIFHMHSENSHMSDPSSVNLLPSIVKYETDDLTSLSPRDSSHESCQLQHMEGLDCAFQATAPAGCEQTEKPQSCQGGPCSTQNSLKNGSVIVRASVSDPGSVEKSENYYDPQGVSLTTPAEPGPSNIQESLTAGSDLDDISLGAASFRQLQLVTKQLDLRTMLCIRDSLYRLAQSAEQRHNHPNLNVGCGEEKDAASGASMTEGTKSFMDVETETNPIDRSMAHLLFHRPSIRPAHDSFPLKSCSAVHRSVASPSPLVENPVSEENV